MDEIAAAPKMLELETVLDYRPDGQEPIWLLWENFDSKENTLTGPGGDWSIRPVDGGRGFQQIVFENAVAMLRRGQTSFRPYHMRQQLRDNDIRVDNQSVPMTGMMDNLNRVAGAEILGRTNIEVSATGYDYFWTRALGIDRVYYPDSRWITRWWQSKDAFHLETDDDLMVPIEVDVDTMVLRGLAGFKKFRLMNGQPSESWQMAREILVTMGDRQIFTASEVYDAFRTATGITDKPTTQLAPTFQRLLSVINEISGCQVVQMVHTPGAYSSEAYAYHVTKNIDVFESRRGPKKTGAQQRYEDYIDGLLVKNYRNRLSVRSQPKNDDSRSATTDIDDLKAIKVIDYSNLPKRGLSFIGKAIKGSPAGTEHNLATMAQLLEFSGSAAERYATMRQSFDLMVAAGILEKASGERFVRSDKKPT